MHRINKIRYFFEKHGFAVSSRIAERLGLKTKNIRLFFIYTSFAVLGFGFFLYLFVAFGLMIKDLVHSKRTSVFDL